MPTDLTALPCARFLSRWLGQQAHRVARWLRAGRHRALLLLLCSGLTLQAHAWNVERIRASAARHSAATQEAIRSLLDTVNVVASSDDETRLATINRFFNWRVQFATDLEVWGEVDYWATPLEMLDKGRGDCEDYAIGKYFSLVAAGVPTARMRLVYVKATLAGPNGPMQQAHMVLAYYPAANSDDPLILDNLVGDIRPASRRTDLAPVFSFNTDGLWNGTHGPTAGDPVSRLSRWRDLLAKVKQEGFL